MPKPNNNLAGSEPNWKEQLERDRLRHLSHQRNVGAPVLPSNRPITSNDDYDRGDQNNWSRDLERNRLRSELTNGLRLPGPGAAAGANSAVQQPSTGKTGSGGNSDTSSASQDPQQMTSQHGLLGAIFKLMGTVTEQATRPALKQLLTWHWGLIPTVKGALISIFVTGPALNMWLIYAHILRKPGLAKFDPFDMLSLMLYDGLIVLLVGVLLTIIALIFFAILCMVSPSDCPAAITSAAGTFF
ncbi:MAG: hypothetical protein V1738_00805 [Patescibacteria group bacterium]